MSKIIVFTAPFDGHFNPFVPIIASLSGRGHEMVCIAARKYEKRVENAGARFHPIPEQWDPGDKDFFEIHPQLSRLTGVKQIKYYLKHIIIDPTPDYLQNLREMLAKFPADIIITDFYVKAGLWIKEAGGPPNVAISVLPLGLSQKGLAPMGLGFLPGTSYLSKLRNNLLEHLSRIMIFRDVEKHTNKMRHSIGLPPLEGNPRVVEYHKPNLLLHMSVPSFEYNRTELPPNFRFIGPVLLHSQAHFEEPEWWPALKAGRPVVLVNQGTVAKDPDNLIHPAIEALRGEDLTVIAVPACEEEIADLPENTQVAPFIPFGNLLPYVDIMVTNGGFGGTQNALAQGIPVIVAGATEDKMEVGARVEYSGAGINLRTQHPEPEDILAAVRTILSCPSYRESARELQAEYALYDASELATNLVEELLMDVCGN